MPSYPRCAAAAPCNDARRTEMRPNRFTPVLRPARASRLRVSRAEGLIRVARCGTRSGVRLVGCADNRIINDDFSPRYTARRNNVRVVLPALADLCVCAAHLAGRAKRRAVAPAHVPPVVPTSRILSTPSTLALTSTARACEVARDRVRAARRRPHWARRALVSASVRAPSVDAHHDARRVLAAVAPLPSRRPGRSARRSARAPLRAPSTPAAGPSHGGEAAGAGGEAAAVGEGAVGVLTWPRAWSTSTAAPRCAWLTAT
jgi:hypothetical protein